ncbi:hypothetical protein A8144_07030 [Mycobacterium leprae 3125609]|nr:hypothetical protein A8144_07030 [Mycobacterium leprae 3125609]
MRRGNSEIVELGSVGDAGDASSFQQKLNGQPGLLGEMMLWVPDQWAISVESPFPNTPAGQCSQFVHIGSVASNRWNFEVVSYVN